MVLEMYAKWQQSSFVSCQQIYLSIDSLAAADAHTIYWILIKKFYEKQKNMSKIYCFSFTPGPKIFIIFRSTRNYKH